MKVVKHAFDSKVDGLAISGGRRSDRGRTSPHSGQQGDGDTGHRGSRPGLPAGPDPSRPRRAGGTSPAPQAAETLTGSGILKRPVRPGLTPGPTGESWGATSPWAAGSGGPARKHRGRAGGRQPRQGQGTPSPLSSESDTCPLGGVQCGHSGLHSGGPHGHTRNTSGRSPKSRPLVEPEHDPPPPPRAPPCRTLALTMRPH